MTANKLFHQGLNRLGLDLSEQAIDQLCTYLAELQKWNKRFNLVAAAPLETLIETHFLEWIEPQIVNPREVVLHGGAHPATGLRDE